jgi:outer membrane protein assembly factor BamB
LPDESRTPETGNHPANSSRRTAWCLAATRIAWIAGIFSLVLGGMLLFNSVRIYEGAGNGRIRLVDSEELQALKARLREEPKNAELKDEVRILDQQLRLEFFQREQVASRGGVLLLVGATIFIVALQIALYLRRPRIPIPKLSAIRDDPRRQSARAGRAVAGTVAGLAGLTLAFVWGSGRIWSEKVDEFSGLATGSERSGEAQPDGGDKGGDPAWFQSPEKLAANWPRFRGPDGSGITNIPDVPSTWDGESGENILWKVPVPLPGENSPLIWGDRIFATGATEEERAVYCFDANSGDILWSAPVSTPQGARAEPPEDVMEMTGYAAPTAVTDGRHVVAIFANGEVAGFGVDGKPLWARFLGTPVNMYGYACSLVMWRNHVIIVFDQGGGDSGKSKILALDVASGETVWSTPRKAPNSWVSPIVIEVNGKPQVITCSDPWVIAYDPATGEEIWKANCMAGDVAPSPVYQNGLVYIVSDQACAAAIRPDGKGDVTDSKIVWEVDDSDLPDMCSLLCDGPRFYMVIFGMLHAFDAMEGKWLWEHDLESEFQASPTLVNGTFYLLNTDGVMIMGTADNAGFKETGRTELDEECGASPSFAPGRIYLRGKEHLYCIGRKDGE